MRRNAALENVLLHCAVLAPSIMAQVLGGPISEFFALHRVAKPQ